MLKLLDVPRSHVLQHTHNVKLPINGPQFLFAVQELTGSGDRMRDVQHVERIPRKRRVSERKF